MNISEMHKLFRSIGQQQGMSAIRAILPEDIDILLNKSIFETCRNIIAKNISTTFKEKNATYDSFISPINALRTIYKQKELELSFDVLNDFYNIELPIENVMMYTSFSVMYEDNISEIKCRLIEGDKLNDTLNDYCNNASYDYPIVSLFMGETNQIAKLILNNKNKKPIKLIINYIVNPTIVNYNENINCNLPDYLHYDIVQTAVNNYFQSIGSTTQSVSN